MTERATLRNCKPCIGSMLHSTVTTVGELVRVRTLFKKDLQAAKEHRRKQPSNRVLKGEKAKLGTLNLGMLNIPPAVLSVSLCFNVIICPWVPAHSYQKRCGKKSKLRMRRIPQQGIDVKRSNWQMGNYKVEKKCKLNGQQLYHEFYIMRDRDLGAHSLYQTDKLGQSKVITHRIYSSNKIPVRKSAYPIPVNKQQLVDEEIKKMLD